MKVTVFGSISIRCLLPAERARVLRLVELGASVLLSDAPGVDLAVQRILAEAGHHNVVIYHRGHGPRNNVGGWPAVAVAGSYTDKDAAMCRAADCALAFWDGTSRGTRRNLDQLKRERKAVRLVTRGRGGAGARGRGGMSVHCGRCGQEWPRDPALEVPCPRCHAAVGVRCRRPSGHGGNFTGLHAARDRAAMNAGLLSRCPGGDTESEQVELALA